MITIEKTNSGTYRVEQTAWSEAHRMHIAGVSQWVAIVPTLTAAEDLRDGRVESPADVGGFYLSRPVRCA